MSADLVEIVDDDVTDEAPMPFVVPAELEEEIMPNSDVSLITILRDHLQADRQSRERLTDVIERGEAAAAARHGELMGELQGLRKDMAVDAAADGAIRTRAVAVAESAWSTFKAPMAWAATAAMTYLVYKVLGIPPTPTPIALTQPVAVEVAPPMTDPGTPPLTGASP